MATYVEINGNKYPASITGRLSDKDWNDRASKAIHLEMTYADAVLLMMFLGTLFRKMKYKKEIMMKKVIPLSKL